MQVKVKHPRECSKEEINAFCEIVRQGDEVDVVGLEGRVRRAEALAFGYVDGKIAGVAGLKVPCGSYRDEVFEKAGVPTQAGSFTFELGWVYVLPHHRGKGHSRSLSAAALSKAVGGGTTFATTKSNNKAMRKTLEHLGFRRLGEAWGSGRGSYELVLYIFLSRDKITEEG